MTYIDSRYYAVHRKQLRMVVRLARLIAANRACSGQVPPALPGGLQRLAETLELHQNREEGSLFSAMMTGPADRLKFPVIHAIREHDEISDQLDTIAKLTGNYLTPASAGRSIQRLYDICGALDGELRLHMHIENNLLFPPFLGDQAGITGWPSNASD
jgi:regulator of cell morphogenesis and NO signaling